MRNQPKNPFEIIAHRGYSAKFPDNSLAAMEAAIEGGADYVELDVRLSADDVLVVFHDPILPTGEIIAETEAKELSKADVLMLLDLLSMIGSRAGIVLDLKLNSEKFFAQVLAMLNELVENGIDLKPTLGVHSVAEVLVMRALDQTKPILGFIGRSESVEDFFAAGGDILRILNIDADNMDPALLKAKGLSIWVTPGIGEGDIHVGDISSQRLDHLMALGIGGVLVNDPVAAVERRNIAKI